MVTGRRAVALSDTLILLVSYTDFLMISVLRTSNSFGTTEYRDTDDNAFTCHLYFFICTV